MAVIHPAKMNAPSNIVLSCRMLNEKFSLLKSFQSLHQNNSVSGAEACECAFERSVEKLKRLSLQR
jgi:hypothetical protein